jgi:hypothetical protein
MDLVLCKIIVSDLEEGGEKSKAEDKEFVSDGVFMVEVFKEPVQHKLDHIVGILGNINQQGVIILVNF